MSTDRGYIVIPNWDRFQHYKDRQPAWIKLHLNLLGNDAWLALSPPDRCLLLTIWMLVGRYGNGRLKADLTWLQSQAKLPLSNRYRGLDRLNDAGFIQFSASPVAQTTASLEKEGSKEPKKESAASGARRNGAARQRKNELAIATSAGRQWLADGDRPHLVAATLREQWPDVARTAIATLELETAENGRNGSDPEKPTPHEPVSAPRADDRDPLHAENQSDLGEITDDDIPF